MRPGFGHQIQYRPEATDDGGWEVDPDKVLRASVTCLTRLHDQLKAAGLRPAAVAMCTFWHSFHGVGTNGVPTTRILHLFDTRSAKQVERLKATASERESHSRTGCVFHTSYWPAKLMWLAENRVEAFARTAHWMSFGEYLLLKTHGRAIASTSMMSATGLWNQNGANYDDATLQLLPVRREQLCPVEDLDQPQERLVSNYAKRWPLFDAIPWYPAVGDGAANNIGSGCTTPDRFALMVGTSGAMRAVTERDHVEIPEGVWCYRVDSKRFVLGGALSNGGFVYDKMRRLLRLPSPKKLEALLDVMEPGAHKLTVLPFFNGERSTKWNANARAAFMGLSHTTTPEDMVRAAMESVALRFRLVYEKLSTAVGQPKDVVATGSALDHSPAWTRMMTDALNRPVLLCGEHETSSRGAALLALERLGVLKSVADAPTALRGQFDPDPRRAELYAGLMQRQNHLYSKLFEEA